MNTWRIPRRAGSKFARHCAWVLALQACVHLVGCQTVRVHPRLRESGHGLERYKTVAIRLEGHQNDTLQPALEAASKRMGYTVTPTAGELNLRVLVRQNKGERYGFEALMIWLVLWNFGVGDALIDAKAQLVEVSTGDTLLEFSAKRTGLTNYSATRFWVEALASTWRGYMGPEWIDNRSSRSQVR